MANGRCVAQEATKTKLFPVLVRSYRNQDVA